MGTFKLVRAAMSILPLQAVAMNGHHMANLSFAPALLSISASTCLKLGHFDRVFDDDGPEAEGWFY